MLDFSGNAEERHLVSATSGTFDLEIVSEVHPETLETFDEEKVDGCNQHSVGHGDTKPDWTSPVAVTTKHPTLCIGGPILDSEFLAVDNVREWSAGRRGRVFLG